MVGFPHSLQLNNIPFYIDATTSSSIHQSRDTIHDWFHVLAIINDAAMDIGVQIYFQVTISISFGYSLRSSMLDHMIGLFLIFLGTSTMFPIAAAPIYNPTNMP